MKKLNTLLLVSMFAFLGIQASYAQVPTTQLRAIDCGKINLTPVAQIGCVAVANANLYQWEFRDINTNAIVGIKNTTGVVFYPGMVNFLNWNTQYHCAIRARVGSTFGSFGPSCNIGLNGKPCSYRSSTYYFKTSILQCSKSYANINCSVLSSSNGHFV
jgi:hypothetical protein